MANHPELTVRPPAGVTTLEIRQIITTIQRRENEGESLASLKAKVKLYERVLREIDVNDNIAPVELAREAMNAAKIEHMFLPIR